MDTWKKLNISSLFYDIAHFNQSSKNWDTFVVLHSLKKSRTLDGNDGLSKDSNNLIQNK